MTPDDDRVNKGLAVLARGAAGLHWPGPAALKRSARRRRLRRRRFSLAVAGVAAGTALAAAAAITITAPAGQTPRVRVAVAVRLGSAAELVAKVRPFQAARGLPAGAAVAGAEQGFAIRLLRQLGPGQAGNVTVSPLSLAVALTMLENGAGGITRSQIAAVLGTPGVTITRQDQGWASLLFSLARHGGEGAFQSADSLWVQQGLPIRPEYLASLGRYFSAGVWQADFAHHLTGSLRAINQWVSEHTGGKIRRLFGPGDIDGGTVAVLANAAHFLGKWQKPFSGSASAPGAFLTAQHRVVRVTFMSQSISHAAISRGYEAVQLPYAGRRFTAVAIMPTSESLATFVDGLTSARLSGIIASASRGLGGQLYLPRFTASGYLRLNQVLAALGMPTAFTPAADFSPMSPAGLQVQSAVQRDYLSVGEKGTEAAAASGISIILSATIHAAVLRFDRPFLFLVRDTVTGAVLFASLIQNPAA